MSAERADAPVDLEVALGRLARVGDPAVQETVRAVMGGVLDLHRAALARMLELAGGPDVLAAFAGDERVAPVLLLHGLHPLDLETRVRAAVGRLHGDGLDVELVTVADGLVRVRLGPAGGAAVRAVVENAIVEAAPDAEDIRIEGEHAPAADLSLVEWVGRRSMSAGAGSAATMTTAVAPRSVRALRRWVGGASTPERCDLCGSPVDAAHDHLLDPAQRQLRCACAVCVVVLGEPAGTPWRRVRHRVTPVPDLRLTDAQWDGFAIPIALTFFVSSSVTGRVVAGYPGAAGVTESRLPLHEWAAFVAENPDMATLEPDVEALLVNRMGEARQHYRVSIDCCYRLAGLIRMHWRGLGGGAALWAHVQRFFADLAPGDA